MQDGESSWANGILTKHKSGITDFKRVNFQPAASVCERPKIYSKLQWLMSECRDAPWIPGVAVWP